MHLWEGEEFNYSQYVVSQFCEEEKKRHMGYPEGLIPTICQLETEEIDKYKPIRKNVKITDACVLQANKWPGARMGFLNPNSHPF